MIDDNIQKNKERLECYVITFKSTYCAIKSEEALLNADIPVSVMPLPSSIKAGCGIALRIKTDDIMSSTEILKKMPDISFELYCKIKTSAKTYNYLEYNF